VILRVFAGADGGRVALPQDLGWSRCRIDETAEAAIDETQLPGSVHLPPARIATWRLRRTSA
jgi:hypothetical protein